ncbi:hypothetical protein Tco_0749967 [Tanacetum coccineum]|uniref:Uncharacterized protein n=1 Tax=Tanacetum coccineum TaxID=301880 RepID=A0ABQ4Z1B2_9ASTR
MERFKNAIFKQREEINDRMAEIFRLLKELITSRAPEKVLIREEAKSTVTKNVNFTSLARGEKERNDNDDMTADDFVILEIKEDKKRPFILGTPLLTTAKAVIKFDKGAITLRSEKSKISFHRSSESICKVEKEIKNDIEPIAHTMTLNRLVLGWEENIKLHLEKEIKFDQWRSKKFKNKHPAPVKVEGGMADEGEVTLYLMRRSLEVLRKFHWMILGGRFNQLSHVSSPLLSKPGEY